ncbi:MAG: hypothetical protein HWE25_13615 [Alphaproteobacteria bacterium]|nr:hypothetical protein [Alphaproteobacteria bacterium]
MTVSESTGPRLDKIQQNIRSGQFQIAEELIFEFLVQVDQGERVGNTVEELSEFANQYVRSFASLISDAKYQISPQSLQRFFALKRPHALLCFASKARGTGFIWRVLGGKSELEIENVPPQLFSKLLAGLSINGLTTSLISRIGKMSPDIMASACFGFLGELMVVSKSAETSRRALSDLLSSNDHWNFGQATGGNFVNVWMGCSYGEADNRHDVKKSLNARLVAYLADKVNPAKGVVCNVGAEKPTVVVMAEVYSDVHAMHRCYGPSIRALGKHFQVVMMVPRGNLSKMPVGLADVFDVTPFDIENPAPFIEQIRSYCPDVLYLPSVGMRLSSITIANLRLAPLQVATNGHPATTNARNVDFMVLVNEVFGGEERFSERIVLRDKGAHYVMRADAPSIKPQIRVKPATVRIAVPAWIRKICPTFLTACEAISTRAKTKVEFHFFPNISGVQLQAFRHAIKGRLKAKVFPTTGYSQYIERLSQCDIHLSTFPFGSSNGIVDAARQGLPLVNMLGAEPHERIDANLVNRLGQPDWLTVRTVEDYIKAVVRLVDDHALRAEVSEAVLQSDPDERMLVSEGYVAEDFGEIIFGLYRHGRELCSGDRRVWTHAELVSLN